MPNPHKAKVLETLRERFGEVRKVKGSESLFIVGNDAAHIYFRYSKVHARGRTFFGLRESDLRLLGGQNAFLCFLLDDGSPPLFVPYADFEEVFMAPSPRKMGSIRRSSSRDRASASYTSPAEAASTSKGTLALKPSNAASTASCSARR